MVVPLDGLPGLEHKRKTNESSFFLPPLLYAYDLGLSWSRDNRYQTMNLLFSLPDAFFLFSFFFFSAASSCKLESHMSFIEAVMDEVYSSGLINS